MKLLYIANLRLPTEKAYGIQIVKMCEAFADGGHEVKLFFPYRKNSAINQDVFSYYSVKKNFTTKEVKTVDFYFPGFLDKIAFLIKNYFSAKALVKEVLKENADFYYTRDERVAKLLNEKNKKVIFECHRFSNKKKLFYSYFKNVNLKIVAISDGLKEDLVKFGIKDSNVLVARDGVDLENFNTEIPQNKMGLPLDKKIIMYVGHLFEWKGADMLAIVATKIPEASFVFVGGTNKDIEKFREKYTSNNILILGHKSYKEIPLYLKSADILVLPNRSGEKISNKYTSPLKLFEYMASGRPIVASSLPSIAEVLNEGNSVLVKSDNAEALAEGIKKILDNSILGIDLAGKALKDVRQYAWEKRVEKIINFIK